MIKKGHVAVEGACKQMLQNGLPITNPKKARSRSKSYNPCSAPHYFFGNSLETNWNAYP